MEQTSILSLPLELCQELGEYLSVYDLIQLAHTCTAFYDLFLNESWTHCQVTPLCSRQPYQYGPHQHTPPSPVAWNPAVRCIHRQAFLEPFNYSWFRNKHVKHLTVNLSLLLDTTIQDDYLPGYSCHLPTMSHHYPPRPNPSNQFSRMLKKPRHHHSSRKSHHSHSVTLNDDGNIVSRRGNVSILNNNNSSASSSSSSPSPPSSSSLSPISQNFSSLFSRDRKPPPISFSPSQDRLAKLIDIWTKKLDYDLQSFYPNLKSITIIPTDSTLIIPSKKPLLVNFQRQQNDNDNIINSNNNNKENIINDILESLDPSVSVFIHSKTRYFGVFNEPTFIENISQFNKKSIKSLDLNSTVLSEKYFDLLKTFSNIEHLIINPSNPLSTLEYFQMYEMFNSFKHLKTLKTQLTIGDRNGHIATLLLLPHGLDFCHVTIQLSDMTSPAGVSSATTNNLTSLFPSFVSNRLNNNISNNDNIILNQNYQHLRQLQSFSQHVDLPSAILSSLGSIQTSRSQLLTNNATLPTFSQNINFSPREDNFLYPLILPQITSVEILTTRKPNFDQLLFTPNLSSFKTQFSRPIPLQNCQFLSTITKLEIDRYYGSMVQLLLNYESLRSQNNSSTNPVMPHLKQLFIDVNSEYPWLDVFSEVKDRLLINLKIQGLLYPIQKPKLQQRYYDDCDNENNKITFLNDVEMSTEFYYFAQRKSILCSNSCLNTNINNTQNLSHQQCFERDRQNNDSLNVDNNIRGSSSSSSSTNNHNNNSIVNQNEDESANNVYANFNFNFAKSVSSVDNNSKQLSPPPSNDYNLPLLGSSSASSSSSSPNSFSDSSSDELNDPLQENPTEGDDEEEDSLLYDYLGEFDDNFTADLLNVISEPQLNCKKYDSRAWGGGSGDDKYPETIYRLSQWQVVFELLLSSPQFSKLEVLGIPKNGYFFYSPQFRRLVREHPSLQKIKIKRFSKITSGTLRFPLTSFSSSSSSSSTSAYASYFPRPPSQQPRTQLQQHQNQQQQPQNASQKRDLSSVLQDETETTNNNKSSSSSTTTNNPLHQLLKTIGYFHGSDENLKLQEEEEYFSFNVNKNLTA